MPGRASRKPAAAGGGGVGRGAAGGRRGGKRLTTTSTTTANDDDDRDHADADTMDAATPGIISGRVKLEDGRFEINKNGGGIDDVASSIAIQTSINVNANKVIYPRRNFPLLVNHQHPEQQQRCRSNEGRGEEGETVGNTNHNNSMPSSSSSSLPLVGYVRATPPGHLLDQRRHHHHHPHEETNQPSHPTQSLELLQQEEDTIGVESWTRIRSDPLKTGTFPKEGFDHILGGHEIRQVDGIPIGGRIVELDGPYPTATSSSSTDRRTIDNTIINNSTAATTTSDAGLDEVLLDGNDKVVRHDTKKKKPIQSSPGATTGGEYFLEPEEEAALQAELAQRRMALARMENIGDDDSGSGSGGGANHDASDGHEYGASRTPLDAPIGSLREKWRVLPHFLKLRGLMKQHIDSFDHFVSVEMKQIVQVSEYCFW